MRRRFPCGDFAAGFGNLGFAAARAADEFCYRSDKLASLNTLDQPRCNAGDERDFALRLRGGKHHDTLAQLLLQIIDKGAQLATFQRVGAQRDQAHAFHVRGAAERLIQRTGGGLHADFFKLAAEALDLVFLRGRAWRGTPRGAGAGRRGSYLAGDLARGQNPGGMCRASRSR